MDKVVRDALQVPAVRPHDGDKCRDQDPPRQAIEAEKGPKDGRHDADAAKGRKGIPGSVTEKGSRFGHGASFPISASDRAASRAVTVNYIGNYNGSTERRKADLGSG